MPGFVLPARPALWMACTLQNISSLFHYLTQEHHTMTYFLKYARPWKLLKLSMLLPSWICVRWKSRLWCKYCLEERLKIGYIIPGNGYHSQSVDACLRVVWLHFDPPCINDIDNTIHCHTCLCYVCGDNDAPASFWWLTKDPYLQRIAVDACD